MLRLAGWLIMGAMVCLIAAVLIGRAIDQQVRLQDRVITTRHGRTIDCRVDRFEDGSISLNDCNYVQVP
jgi:hypothetical protein